MHSLIICYPKTTTTTEIPVDSLRHVESYDVKKDSSSAESAHEECFVVQNHYFVGGAKAIESVTGHSGASCVR